jgi:hypothetical protein
MSDDEIVKLLEKAMFEGVKFGIELESSEDKSNQLPLSIKATVQWRAQEILKEVQNKHKYMRYIEKAHNGGTAENPMYSDWCDIIDTETGMVVYTNHSIMCGHLLKEINNPKEYGIENIETYINKVINMETKRG